MGILRFGLVGNYQAGKSTLINCLIERSIATIGDGTSTTHAVVNYLYGTKEGIEQIDYNGNLCSLEHTNLGRLDSSHNLKEINVYLNIPFLKNIILTDMPGFGKDQHDTMLSEETLNKIDFAIVVETNYKAIEEKSDSYNNIERLKWHNIPYYIILNCADSTKKNWKWTPLYKNNVELAFENIKCLNFYKPLLYPFEEGEPVVVNLLWYWYSITHDNDDVIVRYKENLEEYNDLTKYEKKEIFKFSNFEVVKKIFSMENRAYLELRKDLKEEIQRLKEELCPVGTIQAFAFEKIPQGWLICDGDTYKINEFLELYKAIGHTFGGEGTEEFKVPDLRNQFVRGWNQKGKRTLGSVQEDAIQGHTHKVKPLGTTGNAGSHSHQVYYRVYKVGSNWGENDMPVWEIPSSADTSKKGGDPGTTSSGSHNHSLPDFITAEIDSMKNCGTVRHAKETRPTNMALLYCIKAKP